MYVAETETFNLGNKIALVTVTSALLACLPVVGSALAGPENIVVAPAAQAFSSSCQSYSMALAMSFHAASPYKANTPKELRELELRLRGEIEKSAKSNKRNPSRPTHDDWRAAMVKVSNGKLKLSNKVFANLDSAMRFIGTKTGITAPGALGATISAALVNTPVLMSFHRIGKSNYRGGGGNGSHIVTILGVGLPPATLGEGAKPKLLLVNSAVKFQGGSKNVCLETDLPGDRKYSALTSLTSDYERKKYGGKYILHYVE